MVDELLNTWEDVIVGWTISRQLALISWVWILASTVSRHHLGTRCTVVAMRRVRMQPGNRFELIGAGSRPHFLPTGC